MNHPTLEQLQEYVDTLVTDTGDPEIKLHIRTCEECRRNVHALRQFDNLIERNLSERVSKEFTEQVMKKLGIEESAFVAWNILKNIAPVLAFIVIIAIVYTVLQLSGTFQGSDIQRSIGYTQSAYAEVGNGISTGMNAFSEWAQTYLPFAFAKSNYGLSIFLITFFGVIAILDRILLMPMMKKRP